MNVCSVGAQDGRGARWRQTLIAENSRMIASAGYRTAPVHEGSEIEQRCARFPELEAQVAPHAQIVLNCLRKGVHRVPPGQGSASLRNASMSTFV